MDFDKHRREDNTIDLLKAWEEGKNLDNIPITRLKSALTYLAMVEKYSLIESKENAAILMAQADLLAM